MADGDSAGFLRDIEQDRVLPRGRLLAMANLVVDNLFSFMDGKGPIAPTPETPWPMRR